MELTDHPKRIAPATSGATIDPIIDKSRRRTSSAAPPTSGPSGTPDLPPTSLEKRLGTSAHLPATALRVGLETHANAVPAAFDQIHTNRRFEILAPNASPRAQLRQAGKLLGSWQIHLYDITFDGPKLVRLAAMRPHEPLTRVLREEMGFAVKPDGLLYFLDDVLREAKRGLRGRLVEVPADRARNAGIVVHPDDIWKTPHHYGEPAGTLTIASDPAPTSAPAEDGDPLGPGWVERYCDPISEPARLDALRGANPHMAAAAESLMTQLRAQGAHVELDSTVRNRERGYLMWGSYYLSTATTDTEIESRAAHLDECNKAWGLNIAIAWRHPDGLQTTRARAEQMCEAFGVVYATESGAKSSNHYDGRAMDLVARGLPRKVVLTALDGAKCTFDLSDANEPRDLSLTPVLIEWVDKHFGLRKLDSDYPHWDQATL